jgi:ABC-type Fe2+-enterobactin transport system substrate-binding protein
MKHKAIMEIYPTVKRVVETIDGVITAFDENNNQVNFNISLVEQKATELLTAKEAEKQAKINAKASALAKLTALGLTEEEVKSIL